MTLDKIIGMTAKSNNAIAVNSTTNRIYVVNTIDDTMSVIDGSTNTVLGSPIPVGPDPLAVAVNATTNRVYVADWGADTVSVIDGSTNTVLSDPIKVGHNPAGIAVNVTTNRVYVVNALKNSVSVSVIDGVTHIVLGDPIPVTKTGREDEWTGMVMNATTNRLYVVNAVDGTVSVIDGSTNAVLGAPIPVGKTPSGIEVNATTNRVYVANYADDTISIIAGSSPTANSSTAAATTNNVSESGVAGSPTDSAKAYIDAEYSGASIDQFLCTGNTKVTDVLKKVALVVNRSSEASNAKFDVSALTYETLTRAATQQMSRLAANSQSFQRQALRGLASFLS